MKTPEQSVREFHQKYGHLITPQATTQVPDSVKQLRIKLIEEEYIEFMAGILHNDLNEIADGAADLVYVIVGTCISYGIPFDRIFAEVHNSNMTKTVGKPTVGEKYGTKTPKGPDFMAPQVKQILINPEFKTNLESR